MTEILFGQILVHRSAKHANVHFVQRKIAVVIANEWIVAPVQMGFGSGPCVMGLWYQPATWLLSKLSERPKMRHYFHLGLKPYSNTVNLWQ